MNQWLGNEGILQTVFVKIWDLLILNLCFLAGCLPVFTIGTSLTAMFAVNLKAVRKEEGSVFAEYWKAFKANFGQGTKLWGLMALLGVVFVVDFWALGMLDGAAAWVLKAMLGAMLLVYLAVFPWIFGYNARFADNMKTVLKNALILCGANLPVSAAMLSISFLAVFISFYSLEIFLRAMFIWVVLGFSVINYAQSYLLRRVFDKIAQA